MKKFRFLFVALALVCSLVALSACNGGKVPVMENVTLTEGAGYTLTGEAQAKVGEAYEFTFALLEGYEKGEGFAVKANGEALEVGADGKVSVANVQTALTITVEGVERISNAVSLSKGAGYTLTGAASVLYGEDYTFTFALLEGYEKTAGFAVKVNGEAVTLANGQATVEAVKEALEITVEGIQAKTYAVTLGEGVGYTLSGAATATHDASYVVTIAFAEGYEAGEGFAVKANGKALEVVNGKATVAAVKGALEITVEGVERISNAVTLAQGAGYTLTGEASVLYGEDYTFTFALLEGYKAGEGFAVKVNGEAVTLANGQATVAAVKGELKITVEGVELKTYAVTLTEGVGYTLSGEASVAHGNDYAFILDFAEGYKAGEGFAVKVNGEAVELTYGAATVEAVKGELVITVEGVELKTYAVTLTEGVGYTLSGDATVTHGENYVVAFAFAEGYQAGASFAIKANGEVIELIEGEATVEAVKGALEITVEGVQLKTYAVTLVNGEGYVLSGDATVTHGGDYVFAFELAEGYLTVEGFAVKVNGEKVELEEGIAIVSGVKGALEITVEGIISRDALLGDDEIEVEDQWWLA